MSASSALITLFKTLPLQEQKKVAKWIKEHESDLFVDEERADYIKLSSQGLNRAYGADEPEYTLDDCIELNSNFDNESR